MSSKRTFYVTKWCLTAGIIRVDDCPVSHDGKYAVPAVLDVEVGDRTTRMLRPCLVVGVSAFEKLEDALAHAVTVARSRIAGFEKNKKALEKRIAGWEGK